MVSGGSIGSVSLIWSAITVTVQVVFRDRLAVGSRVMAEPGEPLTVKACGVPVGQSSVNELPVAVTGSLKLIKMLAPIGTPVAVSAGLVLVTLGAASCVVNEKTKFAAGWSGGSPVSLSLMFAATAVTVQLDVLGRSALGSSVIELVPVPLTVNVCGLLSHETVNELVVTSTASLKSTVMFPDGSTSVAPSAGDVVVTVGAESV